MLCVVQICSEDAEISLGEAPKELRYTVEAAAEFPKAPQLTCSMSLSK